MRNALLILLLGGVILAGAGMTKAPVQQLSGCIVELPDGSTALLQADAAGAVKTAVAPAALANCHRDARIASTDGLTAVWAPAKGNRIAVGHITLTVSEAAAVVVCFGSDATGKRLIDLDLEQGIEKAFNLAMPLGAVDEAIKASTSAGTLKIQLEGKELTAGS